MKKFRKTSIRICLEPDQETTIRHLSEATGMSKATIIRLCISQFVANIPLQNDPALNIMNLGESGKIDISQNHDDYLLSFKR